MDINIELKNIRVQSTQSDETFCFQAVLYYEGKRVAEVSNGGDGKPDSVHWFNVDAKGDVEAAFRRSPPVQVVLQDVTAEIPNSLALWCGDKVSHFMMVRDFRKLIGRFVLVAHDENIYQIKRPRSYDEDFKREIEERYPDSLILNDVPEDLAITLFKGQDVVMTERSDFTEASPEELAGQTTRPQPDGYESAPVGGETAEEKEARLERNNERLARSNPVARRQIDAVREIMKRGSMRPRDEHPGARLKNPPNIEDIKDSRMEPKANRGPVTPKNGAAAPGSLSDRLLKAGPKPVKAGSPRAKVAELVCRPEGASTAECVAGSGHDAHAVGNHIFYLRKQHGYEIELRNGKYFGKLKEVEQPEADSEAA